MTRVDFYILAEQHEDARYLFACRLAEKAYRQNLSVALVATDPSGAQQLDQLLWRFQAESFLPHSLSQDEPSARILVTDESIRAPTRDLLINLGRAPVAEPGRFKRIAEIVVQTPDILACTRRSYLQLKEQGFEINTHKLG